MRHRKVKSIKGWGWLIRDLSRDRWLLCYHFFSMKRDLVANGKPSPEAKAIKIEMKVRDA